MPRCHDEIRLGTLLRVVKKLKIQVGKIETLDMELETGTWS